MKRENKKINNQALMIMWLLCFLVIPKLHAQAQVRSALSSSHPEIIFAGFSQDGQYKGYVKKTNDEYQLIKSGTINFLDSQSVSREGVRIIEPTMSPSGDDMVWIEISYDTDMDHQLFRYNYSTDTLTQLTLSRPTDLQAGPLRLSSLEFIQDTGQLTYLLGVGTEYSFNEHLVIHDIQLGSQEWIKMDDVQPEFGWYSMATHDVSDDGSRILYSIRHVFVGSDCCHSRSAYLVIVDTASQDVLHSIDVRDTADVQFMDLSGDGKVVVYQDGGKTLKYHVDSASTSEFYVDFIARRSAYVRWLQLSHDGSVLAIQGRGQFADGRRIGPQQEFLDYGSYRLQFTSRPLALVVHNMNSGQTELVNRFNGVQMYSAQPMSLSADGDVIHYITGQFNQPLGRAYSMFVEHAIEFKDFQADKSLAGAWYNAANPGQGIFISVAPNPDQNPNLPSISEGSDIPLLSWFTVDNQGNPFWLYIEGSFEGNTISGTAQAVKGSQFGANFRTADTETTVWGEVTMTFESCAEAVVSYQPQVEGFEAGQMSMQRLTAQSGLGCL